MIPLCEGGPVVARINVEFEIDEELLADARTALGVETDADAAQAALVEVAKRLRRQEFSDAIKSGEIDFMTDTPATSRKHSGGQESTAA